MKIYKYVPKYIKDLNLVISVRASKDVKMSSFLYPYMINNYLPLKY